MKPTAKDGHVCGRCGQQHGKDVGCAPAIWAGEETIPTGQKREPTEAEQEMGRRWSLYSV
eukprot:SAG11_NODE_1340_length_5165_cov_3.807146_4_plen_60_part_00